jgi:hypothetical protein
MWQAAGDRELCIRTAFDRKRIEGGIDVKKSRSLALTSMVSGFMLLVFVVVGLGAGRLWAQGNPNGAAGQMDSYYDGELFTINLLELPEAAAEANIDHNKSLNEMYVFDGALPGGDEFVMVLDAIQGDGFNPLWREIEIQFNAGFTPHQFTSDTEIEAAATGTNPEITLVETDEVYRCSVVGKK